MTKQSYRKINVDGLNVFYREAGRPDAPALLLLHGFPTSSHMFRDLIPMLADHFRLVAPDLPGFGQSDMPDRSRFSYTFDNIAKAIERFTEIISLSRFSVYVFDYGAPTGFRLAVSHPERITAIISQNGNAYEEGLSEGWKPIQTYWKDPSPVNRDVLRAFLKPETTLWQYTQVCLTRLPFLRMAIRSTTFTSPGPAPMRFNWICLATTRVMSHCIRPSKNTSASTSRSWRFGARTIRSFCQQVPRRSNATFQARPCVSSTLATSRWKHMPNKIAKAIQDFLVH
jgi:pimeloyl-ACP methyl ester carboxylesterase